MKKTVHLDTLYILTAPTPQISGAAKGVLHQLQKNFWSWSSVKHPLIFLWNEWFVITNRLHTHMSLI